MWVRMDAKRTLRWAGYYFALSTAAALVGFVIVGVGATLGLTAAYGMYLDGASTGAILRTAAPGLVVALLGIVVWRIGTAAAFYKTLTGAVDDEMGERFDSERVKSEILSVLDERLSDMQFEIEQTRRKIDDANREDAAGEFEFNN